MLLNYYDARNKEEEQLLDEELTTAVDSYDTTRHTYNYKITRHRTKTYRYVGMDRATAKACAAEKKALYTRTFHTWVFNDGRWSVATGGDYTSQVATAVPQRIGGDMWNVEIHVDETCIAYVQGGVTNPSAAVDAACGSASWRYDE